MWTKKMVGVVAAGAFVALAGVMSAQAQMMVPVPPGGLDVYHYSTAPQAEPGDNPANWSARRNVVESDRYENLVHSNPAFRAARIRKECGSINEPDLHQQCVASFN